MGEGRTSARIAVGMVALGVAQGVYAVGQNDAVPALLGLTYATLGGVLWWRTNRTTA